MVPDTYPVPEVWVNPGRYSGEPCMAGTRVPVRIIAGLLTDGYNADDIAYFYPSVTPEQAVAATEWWCTTRYVPGTSPNQD